MDAALISGNGVVTLSESVQERLAAVPDPELPWVNIAELGVLRRAEIGEGRAMVEVTPTWSGCPAMDAIRDSIRKVLLEAGFTPAQIEIRTVFSPAWSTDDITDAGCRKLREAGIAPPRKLGTAHREPVVCPQCASPGTRQVSEFGSTPCKALMACTACLEPFDRFKEL